MTNAPPEKIFWLKGGTPIKNLAELAKELQNMDDNTYKHHVTPHNNDFSNWIKHVIKNDTLAREVQQASKGDMLRIIDEAIGPEPAKELPQETTTTIIPARETNPKTPTPIKLKPKIIVTCHKTDLTLTHQQKPITSPHKTELTLAHKPQRVNSPYKTLLTLAHTKELPNNLLTIASYLALGIVAGVGTTIIILAAL
ncbi:hypothetical protein HY489_06185 [Candidatus Woesearchaeota archaeon]|nr:hypothetical protein [Candidatus Woesearchaeota archaeon]